MALMPRTLPRLTDVPWSRILATALLALTVLAVVVDVVIWNGQRFRPPPVSFVRSSAVLLIEMFVAISYAAMGWLLATRVPRNPLGWLFTAIGLGMALQMTSTFLVQQGHQAFRPLNVPELWGGWLSSTLHLPITTMLFVFVFLLFPDGRAISPRWARAGSLAVAGTVLLIVAAGLSPDGLIWFPSLPNPLAAPAALRTPLLVAAVVGLGMLVVAVLAAALSMIVRYRRAGEVQRAQLRWIAVGVALLAGGGIPFLITRYALQMDYASGELLLVIALLAGCFMPIAAAVAVLRHRLYDIDLIISRALVYIPLTGILGGMYTAGVAASQRVFVALTGNQSDAAIVITTLVLASAFTPIKNSLQAIVDRRFKPGAHAHPEPVTLDSLSARVSILEHALLAAQSAATPQPASGPSPEAAPTASDMTRDTLEPTPSPSRAPGTSPASPRPSIATVSTSPSVQRRG